MNRTRDYYRHQRERAIAHKEYICYHVYEWNDMDDRRRGQLAKGKVHCSCWMCSTKTGRGWINDGWKHSDKRKLEKGKDLD